MADPPRLSVVIAARNAEATLAETLRCLIGQTDPDWEAIVVDDRSTDRTPEIVHEHQAADPRFRLVSGPGEGVSAARNTGLQHACGENLLFLDSDDWIAPHYVAVMTETLASRPEAAAAYCAYQRVTPDGEMTAPRWDREVAKHPFEVFARRCAAAIHCILIKRAVVMDLGGFDTSLRTCEEWDLWQRVARTGAAFVGLPEALAFYRMRDGSLSENLRIMAEDASVVTRRGFMSDPRRPAPAPEHVHGATEDFGHGPELMAALFAIWCAAIRTGRGENATSIMGELPTLPDLKDSADGLAETISDGLVIGARCSIGELAGRWHRFGAGLVALLKQCEQASTRAGLRRQVQYAIERAILTKSALHDPAPLGLMMGLHVDLTDLKTVVPPGEVDHLYIYLSEADRVHAIRELPVFGSVSPRELAALGIEALGVERYCEIARLLRSRRFQWHRSRHFVRLFQCCFSAVGASCRLAVRRPGSG